MGICRRIWLLGLGIGLSACGSAPAPAPVQAVTMDQLAHHRWVLKTIDGEPVPGNKLGAHGKGLVPELDFGERPHVAGYAGCNRFKGQAELDDAGRFRVQHLATTMMMCPEASMALERRYTEFLGDWSQLQLRDNQLLLTRDGQQWVFSLFDWVQ